MATDLVCWQCGASLADFSLPISRFDECRQCRAALHACRLCRFHDITVAKQCQEPVAEEVRDKERANYCDYFEPRPDAWSDRGVTEGAAAKAALDALFGGKAAESSATANAADEARRKLEELFGGKK